MLKNAWQLRSLRPTILVIAVGTILQSLGVLVGPTIASAAGDGGGSGAAAGQAEEGETVPLSLRESVFLALRNNVEIRIERMNPQIREEELKKEEGAFFYPRVSFEVSNAQASKPAGTVLAGSDVVETESFDFNTGIKSRMPTGGLLSLDFKNKRLESNSAFQILVPQYTSDLALTLVHPLLKNFGVGVNKTKLKVTRNTLDLSKHQLQVVVTNIVSEVQQTYWNLMLATTDLEVRRRSLEFAQLLERRAEAMVAAGRLPAMAILQAKIGVKEREIDLLAGENAFKDAQAQLKALLNFGRDAERTKRTIVPLDRPPFEVKVVSLNETLKVALERRPELAQAKLDLDNKQLLRKLAKNQMLPDLNFVGSVGFSGLAGTPNPQTQTIIEAVQGPNPFQGGYGDALERLFSGDFFSYNVGVTLEVPLGGQTTSDYRKTRLEVEKSTFFLQTLQKRITLEVETAVRGVEAALKAVEGARALKELAQRRLQMAQEGFELGVMPLTAVLEAQKDLAVAERNEMKAIVEYNRVLILVDKVTGATLERFDIVL